MRLPISVFSTAEYSDWTGGVDRREELVNCQVISGFQQYVLVSQDEIKVEVYRQDL